MIHGEVEISRSKRAIPKYFTKFELFGWPLDRKTERFLVGGVGIVRSIVTVSAVGFRFSLLKWTICFSGSGCFVAAADRILKLTVWTNSVSFVLKTNLKYKCFKLEVFFVFC